MFVNEFEYLIAVNSTLLDSQSAKNETFQSSKIPNYQVSHTAIM